MDIGLLTVKGPEYHPNRRLAEAAREKGLSLGLIDPRKVCPEIFHGRIGAGTMGTRVLPRIILPRQGAQITPSSIAVLAHLEAMGIPMVNSLAAVRASKNKFLTLSMLSAAGIRVPDTVFVNTPEAFQSTVGKMGGYPVVCKKTSGRKGRDVFLIEEPSAAANIVENHLAPAEGLILQRFFPPAGRRDFRVMVIGGKVAGVMETKATNGDFRSNFGITGKGTPVSPGPELENIAIRCAVALGLEIAGVDIIDAGAEGFFVIEANYAPGFRGLESAAGADIAAMIIDHAMSFL